jgi:hypothetical protein
MPLLANLSEKYLKLVAQAFQPVRLTGAGETPALPTFYSFPSFAWRLLAIPKLQAKLGLQLGSQAQLGHQKIGEELLSDW